MFSHRFAGALWKRRKQRTRRKRRTRLFEAPVSPVVMETLEPRTLLSANPPVALGEMVMLTQDDGPVMIDVLANDIDLDIDDVLVLASADTTNVTTGTLVPHAQDILELGTIDTLNHNAQTINFGRTFENPVVFAQIITSNELEGGLTMISDVTSSGFTIRIEEPSNSDGTHADEVVQWLAIEAGSWYFADGTRLEVGTFDTTTAVNGGGAFDTVPFTSAFGSTPVVLADTQTQNGTGDDAYFKARLNGATTTDFDVAIEEAENGDTTHVSETIGYLAIEAGTGDVAGPGIVWEAGMTGESVTHTPFTIDFALDAGIAVELDSDDFTYADGNLVGNGDWEDNGGTAPLLVTGGEAVVTHGSGSRQDVQLPFADDLMAGVISATFDIRVEDTAITGSDFEYFAHFSDNGSGFVARLDVIAPTDGGDYTLGLATTSSTAEVNLPGDFNFGDTVSVELSFDFGTGLASVRAGGQSVTSTTASLGETLDTFNLRQSNSSSDETIYIDNLVLGHDDGSLSGPDYAMAPFVFGDLASYNDTDPAALRAENLTIDGIDVRAAEDMAGDAEVTHAAESVGYFAIGLPDLVHPEPALVITGIIDGDLSGGQPKALELFALADIPDLSEYSIDLSFNGGSFESGFDLAGSVDAGDFIYIADDADDFNTYFGFMPDIEETGFNVNGDDVVELLMDGALVDTYGIRGVDGTDEVWEYSDGFAYRQFNTGPSTVFNDSEWMFSGDGVLDSNDGDTTNAMADPMFPIGTYGRQVDLIITGVVEGDLPGGTPKAVEFYALDAIPDLSIYGFGAANNGGGTDGEEFTFPADSLEAGDSIWVATESTQFMNFFGFEPDYTTGSGGTAAANISGDDAIELFRYGQVVDVFGDINTDGSGEPWEYTNGWAYRNDATTPDGSTFVLENWTFSGVGALDPDHTNFTAPNPVPAGTFDPVDLLISGIIDADLPGGQPKALELFALRDIPDLSVYDIGVFFNGSMTGPSVTLSGSASAGEFIYVANNTADFNTYFGFDPTIESTVVNFNGNDAVELIRGGVTIDAYGVRGVDGTGEAWHFTDGLAYRDSFTGPEPIFDETQWTFSGPAALETGDGDTTNAMADPMLPIGTHMNSTPTEPEDPPTLPSILGGFTSDPNAPSTFTFDPNGEFDYLAGGETATQTFTYTIADTWGQTDTAQVIIVVTGIDDTPTVMVDNDMVEVDEGTTAMNTGLFDDPDANDDVTITASVGMITQDAGNTGTWSWSYDTTDGPPQSQTVTITATDSSTLIGEVTFELTVNNVAPNLVINTDPVVVDEGDTAMNAGVFFDVGTDDFVMIDASVGMITQDMGSSGVWNWTFDTTDGIAESQTVTITATDDDLAVTEMTFELVVNNVAPEVVIDDDPVVVDEGDKAVNAGTFSDPGDDFVSISASVGMVMFDADTNNGGWTWMFDSTDGPADSQTVFITADDGEGGVTIETFDLIVLNVAPELTADQDIVEVDEGQTAMNGGTFDDPGTDDVTFSASIGTVVPNPNPNPGQSGTWMWTYDTVDGPMDSQIVRITADDGEGGVSQYAFTLTVNNVAPTIMIDDAMVTVDEGSEATNGGTFMDVSLTDPVTVTSSVGEITQDMGNAGDWTWSLGTTDGPLESQTVMIIATDDEGAMTVMNFELVVNNVDPEVDVVSDAVVVDEGTVATNNGTFDDVGTGDMVTITASMGEIEQTQGSGGAWVWTYDAIDDVVPPQTVTITATDDDGGVGMVTFDLTVNNVDPEVDVDTLSVTVNETATAMNSGSFSDVGTADIVMIDASVGMIVQDMGNAGDWTWTFDTTDGPTESQTVTITATDDDGGTDMVTFDLTVNNVDPDLTIDEPVVTVNEGDTAENGGTFEDVSPTDPVFITASVGMIVQDAGNAGDWTWTFDSTDGPAESQTVTITADDGDGGVTEMAFELVVNNVAPTVDAVTIAPDMINEGAMVLLNGSFTDPGDDTHTVVIDWGDGTTDTIDLTGGERAFTMGHTYADDPPTLTPSDDVQVVVTVTDSDGASDAGADNVVINNVDPTASIDGPGDAVRGQPLVFEGGVVDPGADTFLFIWRVFSDDTGALVASGRGTSYEFVPTVAGEYTVELRINDDDLGTDVTTHDLTVRDYDILVDPDTGERVLRVGGTVEDDVIGVEDNANGEVTIRVQNPADGTITDAFAIGAIDRVVVYGQGGNDRITATLRRFEIPVDVYAGDGADNVTVDVLIGASVFGGQGNDQITGRRGFNTLDGGSGDDRIIGGVDSDFLIGGSGNDYLKGNAGADALRGDAGDDQLFGDAGNDFLNGGSGDDILNGGAGIDLLSGGPGMDLLRGVRFEDDVVPGPDVDILR